MSYYTSAVSMNDVIVIHACPPHFDDVQQLRKKLTNIYNEKVDFRPETGQNMSAKEWKMFDSFISWLTEAWEANSKECYPANGSFVVTNRTTGAAVVFLIDCSDDEQQQVAGVHVWSA